MSYNSFSGDVRLSKLFNNTFSLNLKVVDLSKNAFTGLIPDFSSWTNLTVLYVASSLLADNLFWLISMSFVRKEGIKLV